MRLGGADVAIIGSFRQFYEEILNAWEIFDQAGLRVTTPLGTAILEQGIEFVRFDSDPTDLDDPTIQTVALHRILRADVVFVVAPDGYVGRTTCYEIGRIVQANRPLYFSVQPADLPIAVPSSHVVAPTELIAILKREGVKPLFSGETSSYGEWENRLIRGDFLDL